MDSLIPAVFKYIFIFLLAVTVSTASNAESTTQSNYEPVSVDLAAPWDWIQLTSGEWLKGDIDRMDNFKLYFDSSKLDALTIKWDNIESIYTNRVMAVLLSDFTTVVGRIQTKNGRLYVEEVDAEFSFDDVLNIASGEKKRQDLWSGDLSIGLNLREGNVNQEDLSMNVNLVGQTALNRVQFTYQGHYSSTDDVTSTNEDRVNLIWDKRWNKDWFWRPFFVEFYSDPFQNVDYQWTAGGGIGYFIYERYSLNWAVAAGPAYQRVKYVNTAATNPLGSAAFFTATQYSHEVTDDIDIKLTYQVIFSSTESGKENHHLLMGFSFDLTDTIDLDINAYWDRTSEPQPDKEGNIPEKNDYRLSVGIGWEI
ncbi:DUF481 domain-containing protein [Gilvimarinus chinensis]|uniref:DUF481 domain-containing protein n=1 Tax=Gilvimarinus chinensis TaxID=396005 RepID=UPI00035C2FA0|nr:DUF481 domain-containing protein [Gilvimarinus chinensis]